MMFFTKITCVSFFPPSRTETLSGISSLVTPSVGICFERVGRALVTLHSRDAGDFPENRWSISLDHTVSRLLANMAIKPGSFF